MPRIASYPITASMDPDIAIIANRATKFISLALDKAVAHSIDAKRFPLPSGTLEHLLYRRLVRTPEANPKKMEGAAEIAKEKNRRIDRVQAAWKQRYTSTGRLKLSNKRDLAFQGPLAKQVKLDSSTPIVEQLPRDLFLGGCPQFVDHMQYLTKPLDRTRPGSDLSYKWLRELLKASGDAPVTVPDKKTIQCLIREVKCVDETNGWIGSEAGDDEIYLGGQKVDPCGVFTKIPAFHVKDFHEDGEIKTYAGPRHKAFTDFSLLDQGAWPRAFFATFVLAEKDMGGLGEFLSELVDLTRERLALELINSLGPGCATALATIVPGVVAAAIVVVLAIVVFVVVLEVFDAIKRAWEDDVFPPFTVMMPIDSQLNANVINYPIEGLWAVANFVGHRGHYQVSYSWRST